MDDANSPAITRFMSVAADFMAWIDRSLPPTPEDLLALHWMLARLQAAVIELPAVTSEDIAVELARKPTARHDRFASLINRFEAINLNSYRTILFPLNEDCEPVTGLIADDMADIYHDLESGLLCARDGKYRDAVWEWRFGYFSHWGYHLANAQAALRQYLDQFAAPWFDPPHE